MNTSETPEAFLYDCGLLEVGLVGHDLRCKRSETVSVVAETVSVVVDLRNFRSTCPNFGTTQFTQARYQTVKRGRDAV